MGAPCQGQRKSLGSRVRVREAGLSGVSPSSGGTCAGSGGELGPLGPGQGAEAMGLMSSSLASGSPSSGVRLTSQGDPAWGVGGEGVRMASVIFQGKWPLES